MQVAIIGEVPFKQTTVREVGPKHNLVQLPSIDAAVEYFRAKNFRADLVIAAIDGTSTEALKTIALLTPHSPCLVISDMWAEKWLEVWSDKLEELPSNIRFTSWAASSGKIEELMKVGSSIHRIDQAVTGANTIAESQPEVARNVIEDTLEVIHDAVQRLGFTPEVQAIAKKAAETTLKIMGKNPRLSLILNKFKAREGKYVSSHSLMLAEISSAVANTVGWSSSPTYLKLILASLVHDLPIAEDRLARMKTIDEATFSFSAPEVQTFRLHPLRAAEYAKQFVEVPPDVDTIVFQHHERPDGTGFPRGLFAHQISPLSALFILSHDLLDFFLKEDGRGTLQGFTVAVRDQYSSGPFKKLLKSIVTGIPIQD